MKDCKGSRDDIRKDPAPLRRRRVALGLSVEDLAAQSGVRPKVVRHFECWSHSCNDFFQVTEALGFEFGSLRETFKVVSA